MAGKVKIPRGDKVTIDHGKLRVPDTPIVAFIEGDGTGPDIWRAAVRVLDAAVEQAYQGKKKIAWAEVYAGEKAQVVYGRDCPPNLLPDETLDVIREYLVAIKGPLTTPVGEGFRSLNVTLRQVLDLYVCLRPVKYFKGVPSPVKRPDKVDMVIFRENTEDIYAGIEWAQGTPECRKVVDFLRKEMKVANIRFPNTSSIGIKPVSKEGSERLIRAAIRYAIENSRKSVTLVHKGNSSTSSRPPTSRAISCRTPWRRRWAGSASRPARTSTTRPGTRCSRRRTAPHPNTRVRTRSTRARSSSRAR